MFIGLVVAFVVVVGVVVHSSLAKEKDVEQEEQLPVFGGRRGQAFVISFARKDAGEYPPEWDKKNKDAFEKVEKEKQEGKKPKPSDKARHDIYKKKLDREKRRKHERS